MLLKQTGRARGPKQPALIGGAKHDFGRAWSQVLGCDGEAHTMVWVSIMR
jgi:hypothetical protein